MHLIGILDMAGSGRKADVMPVLMRSIQLNGIFVGSEAMFQEMTLRRLTAAASEAGGGSGICV